MADIQEGIQVTKLRRAAQIRKMGEYLGFFEFVLWASVSEVRPILVVGRAAFDLPALFAPFLDLTHVAK